MPHCNKVKEDNNMMPTRRDIRCDLPLGRVRDWHPRGAHVSHFFNALSIFFPLGERFFIASVRAYRDQIDDPELQKAVTAFIGQEAMHGREHEAYNDALRRANYPVDAMLRWVQRSLWAPKHLMPPKGQLAMTAALEHLTAIGAEDLLKHGAELNAAPPDMAKLWRWHALEETEHKAVAYDVYQQVAGGLVGYLRRCFTMLTASTGMTLMTWAFLFVVTWRNGQFFDLRGWGRLLRWLWVNPGTLRAQFPRYWQWFRPGFHPWQIRNYHQVEQWKGEMT